LALYRRWCGFFGWRIATARRQQQPCGGRSAKPDKLAATYGLFIWLFNTHLLTSSNGFSLSCLAHLLSFHFLKAR
jgi:hypothetical protein